MSYLLMVNAEGKLEGRVWYPGTEAAVVVLSDEPLPVAVGESPPNGGWVHVALERSSTGELALYVDDAKQTDVADADFALADTGESFRIGAAGNVVEGDPEDGMYFVGVIDEVRLSVMTAGTPARGEAGTLGLVIVNYVYNARNQLVTETSGTSVKTYSYDPNGNVLSIVETVATVEVSREDMTYDELNRMLTHTGPKGTETFTYRGAEWHRASANGTSFLYDGDNVLADIGSGGVQALHVTPFLDQNLSITKDAATYYYSQDGLGSVRTLTDSSGGIVSRYDYLPFGEALASTTTVTVPQRYTYTGRVLNPESFNGSFRDECLNMELLSGIREARELVESWRCDYNDLRPHSSLGYKTPSEFARTWWKEEPTGSFGARCKFAPAYGLRELAAPDREDEILSL